MKQVQQLELLRALPTENKSLEIQWIWRNYNVEEAQDIIDGLDNDQ